MANAGILICVPAGESNSVDRILPFLKGVLVRISSEASQPCLVPPAQNNTTRASLADQYISRIGRHVINLSPSAPGTASHLKLIGNVLVIGMVESVATAHVLAEKSGMDSDKVYKVIKACFPNPFATYSKRMSSGDYYRDEVSPRTFSHVKLTGIITLC
jgi:hypothetical protein